MFGAAAGAAALLTVVTIGAFTVTVVAVDSAYPHASISTPGSTGGESAPSPDAVADIPPDKLALYREAASDCPGLDWTVLAGIGKVETDHGRSRLPGVSDGENSAGAAGPMQFLASTFDSVTARHHLPAGGASPPSRYNASDAIHAAAFYLCDSGADHGDVRAAIFAYNHADWYVDQVLARADRYRATTPAPQEPGTRDCEHLAGTDATAATVLAFACAQLGQPYVWGGNGPQASGGWDCSGLTKAAYAAAGIALPRTAAEQYHVTTRISVEEIRPGDLLFYANENDGIHHVGLYLGNNQMVDAPDLGQRVKIENYRYPGDDFLSATRTFKRDLSQ
ncbi:MULTISPECIES: C40 family peptidase [Nocardia]|uniref:C40 family peptidase n=1 Tax=Nocardia TaxID=1817 RepID=UPI0007EBE935|nr:MULTISPECIES: bifunctional lytic transglycosylase/C40 family peptidase [Nocardia]MBF6278548.1 bifunctional lytic transglycosylase/C40 family peptidase [Nocardia nova]OBA53678.1 hydrolase Nlp/P60 [Nocardia sp. 852002-51101_SCH5132738]OBB34810.1 hydrolase Nlp/P60 [Nocardia sp. 852002-51244_SCH5132740]OBF80988.1 hydrolase Nlp/P60 [Mycobacterium sp. 852002-51759_SCH5129042]